MKNNEQQLGVIVTFKPYASTLDSNRKLQIPSFGQHIPGQWMARVCKEFPSSYGIAHIPSSEPVYDNKIRGKQHNLLFVP